MSERIAVIGLGYVGLPLAVALARHYPVVGFDISARRLAGLRAGHDGTGEVESETLKASRVVLTDDVTAIKEQDIYIVTVPTPVDGRNEPDLSAVLSACDIVGRAMGKGAVVVFESTVYPGVTEKICGPALARASGMTVGVDFQLGYSPERINPGDKVHTVESVVKVVAGATPEVAARLGAMYGKVNGGKIFLAKSIMAAEAAKVIENAQRDINIAFINEVSTIFRKLELPTYDVLEAAATKWNFLNFTPGLVGGHCIGVDPFYLASCARGIGHNPEIILSGRRINDGMAEQVGEELHEILLGRLKAGQVGRVLVLGLTFKEDVPDLRNSKVADLIAALARRGHLVSVHDPVADAEEAAAEYELALLETPDARGPYDLVVGAVGHAPFRALGVEALKALTAGRGVVADLKGMWRGRVWPEGMRYWEV